MDFDKNWSKLLPVVLTHIGHRLSSVEDYIKFTVVCKSWKSAAEDDTPPFLPPKYPLLLLAEEVVPGSIISDGEYDSNGGYSSDGVYSDDDDDDDDDNKGDNDDDGDGDNDNDEHAATDDDDNDHDEHAATDDDNDNEHAATADDGDNDNDHDEHAVTDDAADDDEEDTDDDSDDDDTDDSEAKKHVCAYHKYDHQNSSIGSSRGLYSLSTGKTYTLDLPEASGRLILGANHGWLVTLGRDLQIHLLHPLLRYQIPLPPMLTLPIQYEYNEEGKFTPEERSDMFLHKVVLSSKVTTKDVRVNLHDSSSLTPPIVMVSYGECGYLAFARLGDKVWTHVDMRSRPIHDIAYHKGRFFAVNNGGEVFVCDIEKGGGSRATKIASLPYETFQNRKYLVESISGTLLLILHNCKHKNFYPRCRRTKYRTTDFLVWKLELQYSYDDSLEIPSCTLIEENNLGKQAIFVGRGSSVSVSSSEIIRPNCIYFTDDRDDCYFRKGGGHDMGIFNMENHTIEPHFPGKSIHFISPPLWYI